VNAIAYFAAGSRNFAVWAFFECASMEQAVRYEKPLAGSSGN
jgi:hypothetical protein